MTVIHTLPSASMADRHLQIDIETLDVSVTSVILAIGAVAFNPRGNGLEGEPTFHTTISRKTQRDRSVSQQTVEWWQQQSEEARASVFGGDLLPLHMALTNLTHWINRLQPTCTRVWAKSPDFDCAILTHACKSNNLIWPFKFWEARCVRTIIELAYPEGDFPIMKTEGPKHDALTDAKKQALEVQHAYHILGA